MSEQNKKDIRRQKFEENHGKKHKVSEEQRFVSKNKKQFKKHIEDIRAEELWEDWDNEIY